MRLPTPMYGLLMVLAAPAAYFLLALITAGLARLLGYPIF